METTLKTVNCQPGAHEKVFNIITLPPEVSHFFIGNWETLNSLFGKGKQEEDSNVFCYEISNSHLDWIDLRLNLGENGTFIDKIRVSDKNSSVLVKFDRVSLKSGKKVYAGCTQIVVDWVSDGKILLSTKFKKKIVRYTLEVLDSNEFLIGSSENCSIFIKGDEDIYGKLLFENNEWVVECETDMWIPYNSRETIEKLLPFEVKFTSGFKVVIFNENLDRLQDFP